MNIVGNFADLAMAEDPTGAQIIGWKKRTTEIGPCNRIGTWKLKLHIMSTRSMRSSVLLFDLLLHTFQAAVK